MSQISDRYRNVAAAFSARAREVPADKWDAPNPCEGWTNRDVVKHLAEWVPAMFASTWELPMPTIPSADDDPVAAWEATNEFCQSCLDDAALASSERETPMGTKTFEDAFEMIALSDVVIHTWDLARGAGLDETLDAGEVERLLGGMAQLPDEMRGDFFGPKHELGPDATDQDRMLGYSGRRP
ncbi:MAG: hypothetical protein QOK28_2424 [Actinomycetota bacterium]|jgi:uncharacterized protein (TIGR03086 family)